MYCIWTARRDAHGVAVAASVLDPPIERKQLPEHPRARCLFQLDVLIQCAGGVCRVYATGRSGRVPAVQPLASYAVVVQSIMIITKTFALPCPPNQASAFVGGTPRRARPSALIATQARTESKLARPKTASASARFARAHANLFASQPSIGNYGKTPKKTGTLLYYTVVCILAHLLQSRNDAFVTLILHHISHTKIN